MRETLLLLVAALLAGCFPPKPAAERPLSYRAPIPGWVRHDVDSTLSLLLPPELKRQPRADTAFAPVFFLSDSALVTVRFGSDANRALSEHDDSSRRIGPADPTWLRNGNPGWHLRLRPLPGGFEHRQAVHFGAERSRGFFPYGAPIWLPENVAAHYPSVWVRSESADSLDADRVFDYIRLAFSPSRP
jgi:hypothetical protein